jgi:hypothetical protein
MRTVLSVLASLGTQALAVKHAHLVMQVHGSLLRALRLAQTALQAHIAQLSERM